MHILLNRNFFQFAALSLLLFSCGGGEEDCRTSLEHTYGKAYCPNCEILIHESIAIDFEESDTLIFSYTGTDTLIFEHRDSLGNLDTVTYIGQGKNKKLAPQIPGQFGHQCVNGVYASYFSIEFLPDKPAHKPLFFDLWAGFPSSYFTYDFMNARLNLDVDLIHYGVSNGYMPIFNFRGREYYHVRKIEPESTDGSMKWFYISKESQLVFAIGSDSSYYLKIN
ncbi:MAG: hypothetical protein ACYC1Q_01650 [Bacteroidia bacterium]